MAVGIGQRIAGRYRLEEELGQGGMGVVFRAIDDNLERPVAIKLLHPTLTSTDFQTRFEREATVLAKVASPHIVTIFDHGNEDGLLYLVTQFLPDQDLQRRLKAEGGMGVVPALELGLQVAEALRDAHEAGVIHRDVKPANVLLWERPDGLRAHLGDFGIAQDGSAGLTATGGVIGSLAYMAPERHLGKTADARGDIYSLGCLIYAVATGDAPYSGTDFQLMNAHIHEPVPRLPAELKGADACNAVLDRCLSKDPDERFQDATSLMQGLRDALDSVGQFARSHPAALVADTRSVSSQEATPPQVHHAEPTGAAGNLDAPDITAIKPRYGDTELKDRRSVEHPTGLDPVDPETGGDDVAVRQDLVEEVPDTHPSESLTNREGQRSPVKRFVVLFLVTLVLAAVVVAAVIAGKDESPSATADAPAPQPSAVAPSERAGPKPGAPRVTSKSGYRSVFFDVANTGQFSVQRRSASGWQTVPRSMIRVDVPEGGDRTCASLRLISDAGSAGPVVRRCGTARPKTVRMFKVPGACVLSTGNPCHYYSVEVTGFRDGARLPVRLVSLSRAPLCGDCDTQPLPVGQDGRGVLAGQFHTDNRPGEFKVPVDYGQDFFVIVAGIERRVSVA